MMAVVMTVATLPEVWRMITPCALGTSIEVVSCIICKKIIPVVSESLMLTIVAILNPYLYNLNPEPLAVAFATRAPRLHTSAQCVASCRPA